MTAETIGFLSGLLGGFVICVVSYCFSEKPKIGYKPIPESNGERPKPTPPSPPRRGTGESGGNEQLLKAIALLDRWMDDPDQDLLLCDTDNFIRETNVSLFNSKNKAR